MPRVTHSQPVWPVRSLRSARSGSRSPVRAEGTCAEKIGTVDSAITLGVCSLTRSISLVTRVPAPTATRAAADRGVFVQIVHVEQPRLTD